MVLSELIETIQSSLRWIKMEVQSTDKLAQFIFSVHLMETRFIHICLFQKIHFALGLKPD